MLVVAVFGSCKDALNQCILVVVHQVLELVDYVALSYTIKLFCLSVFEGLSDSIEVLYDQKEDLMWVTLCIVLRRDLGGDGAIDFLLLSLQMNGLKQ